MAVGYLGGDRQMKGRGHKAKGTPAKRRPKSGRRDKPVNRNRYTRDAWIVVNPRISIRAVGDPVSVGVYE